jgi:hypothetical protein
MPILHDDAHFLNPTGVANRNVDFVHGLARHRHGKLQIGDKLFL